MSAIKAHLHYLVEKIIAEQNIEDTLENFMFIMNELIEGESILIDSKDNYVIDKDLLIALQKKEQFA